MEAAMAINDISFETKLPYGSVWLVSTGDGDPTRLSPLAIEALGTADAVIHDTAVPPQIPDFVKPARYREAAAPKRAIERATKLALDGWRVAYFVEGDAMLRAVECATNFAEHNIPFRIAPAADEPLSGKTAIGLLLVRKVVPVGCTKTGTLVVLIATPQSEATSNGEQGQPPISFSMSGLAG
jgi:uroporphyrin-III C-methyltransferase